MEQIGVGGPSLLTRRRMGGSEEGTRDHMVRILKDAGADVNMKDKNGCTALIHACEQRCNDIVRILVQHCNINPDIEDLDVACCIADEDESPGSERHSTCGHVRLSCTNVILIKPCHVNCFVNSVNHGDDSGNHGDDSGNHGDDSGNHGDDSGNHGENLSCM
ncbi:hypothetical protein Btru_066799 [Bulinus truncatus]|nr:hypothetical protein Btru_066799 [Bulinus truncatus]